MVYVSCFPRGVWQALNPTVHATRCPPSKVQGRVGGQAFCWCAISSIAALFYIFFSIRLLPDSSPNIVALIS